MPRPVFTDSAPSARTGSISVSSTASRLGVKRSGVERLIKAGMLSDPIPVAQVEALATRPKLRVRSGELTVLRVDARGEHEIAVRGDGMDRSSGFHVDLSDDELTAGSLRWWRCDPDRILANELLAVTVSTVPVAVLRVTGLIDTRYRAGEDEPRHSFDGVLLGRLGARGYLTLDDDEEDYRATLRIFESRISAEGPGMVGFLPPNTPAS